MPGTKVKPGDVAVVGKFVGSKNSVEPKMETNLAGRHQAGEAVVHQIATNQ